MGALPTDDEVLTAATNAGWLLEQEAVRILDQHNFHPRPSWAFQDSDEPTSSRELDVWSYRRFLTDDEARVTVSASILVECKQSATPYCAIGHEPPDWRRVSGAPTEHLIPIEYLPIERSDPGKGVRQGRAWDLLGFADIANDHVPKFRATQLTRLDHSKGGGWSASNAGVFTSLLYPLAKALRAAQRDQAGVRDVLYRRKQGTDNQSYVPFVFFFPVVLISCPLYVIDAGKAAPEVSQARWVRTQRELKSKSTKGMFEFDIVTSEAFSDYINELVVPYVESVAQAVAERPLRYTGEDWTPPEG